MKIEKLNENQLRATLSHEDLLRRQIRFSEFAYGTEAARALFQELLRFASYKLGFEVDDSPIMVEAIPVSGDSLVLIITKIPYPDELDTRFARFSDAPTDENYLEYSDEDFLPSELFLETAAKTASEIIDALDLPEAEEEQHSAGEEEAESEEVSDSENTKETPESAGGSKDTEEKKDSSKDRFTRQFLLSSIDEVLAVSRIVGPIYHGDNSLYRTSRGYELVLHIGNHTARDFNRIINVMCEYGQLLSFAEGQETYFSEHSCCLLGHLALQTLANI